MLHMIGAVVISAYATAELALLIGLLPVRAMAKLSLATITAGWLAVIVGLYASGVLRPGMLGPVPVNFLPFTLLLALLLGSWVLSSRVRGALIEVPLPALVAMHIRRIGGIFFLFLHAAGRLSAPFAPIAGLGDMITGAGALILVLAVLLGVDLRKSWFVLWNSFGTLDLVVAITLGLLSAAGTPFRVFTEAPGMLAMASLPYAFVPALLVPLDLFIHTAIAAKLRSLPRSVGTFALAT